MIEGRGEYPMEILNNKTKDELIELVGDLQEENSMLAFLLNEYEASQEAMGNMLQKQLTEHLSDAILISTKTGEA